MVYKKQHVRRSNDFSVAQIFSFDMKDESCMAAYALFVGKNVKFKGDVMHCDIAIIRGSSSGFLEASKVHVSEHGNLEADGNVDVLDVGGTVCGCGFDAKFLSVRKSGRVKGEVTFLDASIDYGGIIAESVKYISSELSATLSPLPCAYRCPDFEAEMHNIKELTDSCERSISKEPTRNTGTYTHASIHEIFRDVQKLFHEEESSPSPLANEQCSSNLFADDDVSESESVLIPLKKDADYKTVVLGSSLSLGIDCDDSISHKSSLSSCTTVHNSLHAIKNHEIKNSDSSHSSNNFFLKSSSHFPDETYLIASESSSKEKAPFTKSHSEPFTQLEEANVLLKEFIKLSTTDAQKYPAIFSMTANILERKIRTASEAHEEEILFLREKLKNYESQMFDPRREFRSDVFNSIVHQTDTKESILSESNRTSLTDDKASSCFKNTSSRGSCSTLLKKGTQKLKEKFRRNKSLTGMFSTNTQARDRAMSHSKFVFKF